MTLFPVRQKIPNSFLGYFVLRFSQYFAVAEVRQFYYHSTIYHPVPHPISGSLLEVLCLPGIVISKRYPLRTHQCTLSQQDTALFKGLFSFPHHLRVRRFLSCLLRCKLYQKIALATMRAFSFPTGICLSTSKLQGTTMDHNTHS